MGYRLLSVNLSGGGRSLALEAPTQGNAVYAYPQAHYATWQTMRAQALVAPWGQALPFGSFGELLTIEGLVETDLWVGDVLQFSRCLLAVNGPGDMSHLINERMGFSHARKMMIQSGWCGFYLSVREPGLIEAGETFVLAPGPRNISIPELFAAATGRYDRRR